MKFFLFVNEVHSARRAAAAGIDVGIVDCESKGKSERQLSGQFEINGDTPETALAVESTGLALCVRVNALGPHTQGEIDTAVSCGASTLMLPMSRSSSDVEVFVDMVAGRAAVLVQIETAELLADVDRLASVAWDHAHVGLNDLMLSRGCGTIWDSLADGTVEQICAALAGRSYGFGGLTVVDGGSPIPAHLVISEMVTLGCSMGILRRSFKADIAGRSIDWEVERLRRFILAAARRSPTKAAEDRAELYAMISELAPARP